MEDEGNWEVIDRNSTKIDQISTEQFGCIYSSTDGIAVREDHRDIRSVLHFEWNQYGNVRKSSCIRTGGEYDCREMLTWRSYCNRQ